MADFDIVVIGGGPGGYEAALRAAELGMRVAIVERRDIGGTCLNRGCVPTKTLLHSAELYSHVRNARDLGVNIGSIDFNIGTFFKNKADVSKSLRDGLTARMEGEGINIVRGIGTLCGDGHVVRVVGSKETREITGKHIIIASGAQPAKPPIPGLDLNGVFTSDDLLDGSGENFDDLIIIGGGVIGVEFAAFYSSLGCNVTILEGLSHLLPPLDKELGQNLAAIFKKRGINIFLNAMVSGVVKEQDGRLRVDYKQKGETLSVIGSGVLCAIGRVPVTEGLLADGLSVEMEKRRIKVNENFETNLHGVYAIGDVAATIQLAHVAAAQGRRCVENIAGVVPEYDANIIPSCVYTAPEIAAVGMTFEEAKTYGVKAVVGKYVMFSNARTLIAHAPRSFIKVVVEENTHRVIGAQLMCERASDIISEFTEAIVNGLTVEEFMKAVRPHPTFEEGTQEALRDAAKKLNMR